MKKITITFVLSILFIGSQAQNLTYRITQTKTLSYSDYNEEWIAMDSSYPSEMYAFFNDKKIKITDAANSNYVIYGSAEKKTKPTYVTSKWSAIDEKQRDCIIMLQIINPGDKDYQKNILYIMYKSLTFLYVIEPTE
jgi:hypothetical protein